MGYSIISKNDAFLQELDDFVHLILIDRLTVWLEVDVADLGESGEA